jgi:segregation and condensation protein B
LKKTDKKIDAMARIEAALYASGRPLKIEEIVRASGTESRTKTMEILLDMMKKTKATFKALEIVRLPDGSFVFQLKPEYVQHIKKYASKPILPKSTQKTLSYIAYSQPVSSKQLVETRGSAVYAHIKELRQLDFIRHESVGRLKIYTTTEKFQKYFGIQGDTDNIKEKLFKKVRKMSQNTLDATTTKVDDVKERQKSMVSEATV